MKQYFKSNIYGSVFAFLTMMLVMVSCTDDVVVKNGDYSKYEAVTHPYGYIKNAIAPSERLVDLYQAPVEKQIEVGITKTIDRAVDMKITLDESILAAYNSANNSKYVMLPGDLVSVGQGSVAVIPPGQTKSEPVKITILPSANLVKGTTYVIPLRISTDDAEIELTDAQKQYLFFVVAQGDRLDAAKSAGYKVLSCMETGDADPRINGEFFLANEGKPLFDIVVLFSANMNYNASTGKVYVHMNNSVGAILNNRDRYLKPLQDKGIKVVLGLIGNHDPAGVSHLEQATAVEFVKTQLKPLVEAYGLDGVFWDDEYTNADPSIPGFSRGNKGNASRLIFETKRAMPDKLNIVFAYSTIGSLSTVDGVQAGEYVDYFTSNYGSTTPPTNFFGSTTKQGMPVPYEFARNYNGYPSRIVEGNWGGIMVFGLSEHRSNWSWFGLPALRDIASTMFNDELYYTGKSYPVKW